MLVTALRFPDSIRVAKGAWPEAEAADCSRQRIKALLGGSPCYFHAGPYNLLDLILC
jgi:hypothetical protein